MLRALNFSYLNSNALEGPIPSQVGNLRNVTKFHVQNNLLSQTVPKEVGQMSSLVELYLTNNSFVGTIPPLPRSLVYCTIQTPDDTNCFDCASRQQCSCSVGCTTTTTSTTTATTTTTTTMETGSIIFSSAMETSSVMPANGSSLAEEPASNGALIGGVVGGILVLLLLVGIVVAILLVRRRREQSADRPSAPTTATSSPAGSLRNNVYGSFVHPTNQSAADRSDIQYDDVLVEPRTYGSLDHVAPPTAGATYAPLPNQPQPRYESPNAMLQS